MRPWHWRRGLPPSARRAEAGGRHARHLAQCRPARPDPAWRGRRRDPVRRQHRVGPAAREPDPPAAAGRSNGRPATTADRDRPGGGRREALELGAPDPVAAADGGHRQHHPAASQGKATGRVLACAGVNNNLAPWRTCRHRRPRSCTRRAARSRSTLGTASLSNAFASGLVARGVLPAMKHFPGLGFATAIPIRTW